MRIRVSSSTHPDALCWAGRTRIRASRAENSWWTATGRLSRTAAFSGKDATKVDRSGAYMARYIAKNIVAAQLAERCQVTLAYAIGAAQPVMLEVDTFGTGTVCADDCLAMAARHVFGLTPLEIIRTLQLTRPIFARTACYGHFGRAEFPWERENRVQALRDAVL